MKKETKIYIWFIVAGIILTVAFWGRWFELL